MGSLEERDLARLTPQQRAALETLLWQRRASRPPKAALEEKITRRTCQGGPAPLSHAQRRLWFIDQLEPGSPLYNMPATLRVEGPLRPQVLVRTLGEIVRRHEALRTVFAAPQGSPVQVIQPAAPFLLSLVDLSKLPASRREAEALLLASEEAVRPFDLARGPLLRSLSLRLADEEHLVALTMHHITSDGWSIGILVREIMALYAAFAEGRPSPLPELPVQYADFALWQLSRLQGEVLEREISYWRRQLAGLPPLLELPTDRPRPAVQSFRGDSRSIGLPAGLTRQAQALSWREEATLFMVLLAAFQVLLARYSGQTDLAVGSAIAGRDQAESEGLIGFFVNTLVLRGDLSGEPSFRELLGRVRETALSAFRHQEVPFDKLVEELAPERSLAHAPLFQVMFILQNAPVESLAIRDLRLRPVSVQRTTAKFDLTFNLGKHDGGLVGAVRHSTDLFDTATVDRLITHYERLLTAALAAPELPAAELPLLTAAERHQLLAEWGGTAVEPREAPALHRRFEAQARNAPEAVALTFGDAAVSYGELNRRANQLARWLRRQGIGAESRVGLCLERSPDLVVGILGILKAGGAYVPLDPDSPRERLAYMIGDAEVEVVVGTQGPVATLPETTPRILLDVHRALLEMLPAEDPEPLADGASLAYVIYTSGSTGRPKGALVTHGNVARLFAASEAWFGFAASDVWTLFHSSAFDFSVWEIWGALLHGGRLVIVPWDLSRSPELFRELLTRERVTVLNQTPSAFAQLARVDEERRGTSTCLRLVIFGGEALDPAGLAPWFARHGDARPLLVNMYGITETTVHVTYRPLRAEDARGERLSVIGIPLPDLSLAVLDPAQQPVPIGVPGELAIGGAGLARGYLGRPELTAERFVPDPTGARAGARLYRSGDLGRFLPHGEVEYLGRIDHQVKIRGFRIELGEIEAALAAVPGVSQATVIVREDTPGDRRLVAYVAGDVAAGALRQSLRERLPEYMVPAAFVALGALPLNLNGKVDRKALPAPEQRGDAERRLPPRTPLEEDLASLWREVLGVESVGVHDSFFDLGGNSITGVILINRLQRKVDKILHVVTLFDAPTVAKMAAYLSREHREVVARLWGTESLDEEAVRAPGAAARRVDAAQVAAIRALIQPLAPSPGAAAGKNPPAVFVLSPPRSGSTLLRVMLGGHPRLFAPPELELLSFNSMAEREAAFPGRDSFWLEGMLRAIMELRDCDVDEAQRIVRASVEEGWTTQRFYRQLQAWLGDRTLVDKTPSYALDPAVLRRAEETFERPFYVHLVRHPYAVIRSFEEAKLDELFFRHPHELGRTELAELIWLVSHQNIAELLSGVPAERQLQLRFEDLVRNPEAELRRICTALELEFHPAMADPYREKRARMTDGIHAGGRMLGDVKFLQYRAVEASVGERWREAQEDSLGEQTWEMSVRLGYQRPAPPLTTTTIPRARGRDEPFPLSFAQQRLWFIDQLEPDSPLYNIPVALRVEGPLHARVLAACLGEIVRRHETLRTAFAVQKGLPVQVIQPAVPFPLLVVDLSGLPERRREMLALDLAGEEAVRPFDLGRGRLLRGLLLRHSAEDHTVLLTMHHIASDGWSMGILVREVAALYAAFAAGSPPPLPELPVQYADFAVWQSSWLQGDLLEGEISFWRQQLAGLPPLLELPADRPRPAVQSFRGASRRVGLPSGLTRRAQALSRREDATLFMVLLAAFQALLARYSGQVDFAVGTPIAGRNQVEIEGLIGFFVNTLVLRGDLSGRPTFRELLGRVRKIALAAYQHQDVPFEKLVEELAPERSLAHAPLFQVMFALQNTPVESLEIRDLRMRAVNVKETTAKFDLMLSLQENNGELSGMLAHASDLFDRTTIARLAGHFERLLATAMAAPELSVAELPLLTETEHGQVLVEWNDTEPVPAPGACLHELFEAQALRTPEAVALLDGARELRYRELDRAAGRLAARLRQDGAGPEVLAGVCLERSAEMVIALLAILRAGAAYLPLDPRLPRPRLAEILANARASVVISHEGLAARLPWNGPVVWVNEETLPLSPPLPRQPTPHPENLAYVLFTSGSTGTPKGIAITHRSAVALVRWAGTRYTPQELAGVLAATALSFDLSVFELFVPLSHGGTVILAQNALELPHLLSSGPAEGRVTLVNTVPSAMAELVREGRLGASVRTVNLAGEPLPRALADRVYATGAVERVWNLYGPSEDTTYSTFARVARDGTPAAPAIGRPITATQAYVLASASPERLPELRPVPVGIAGELYLGGAGLARGYLHRPDWTAERFLPDPFSAEPGARLYRTGDRVRWTAAGELEFLGRLDHQVKIRGFRIELGEIEAALGELPGVREAVVVARADGFDRSDRSVQSPGDRRLVAYVVGDALADVLRRSLYERLPDYMVPAAFVTIPALPLTPHGKVDRKALPAPERHGGDGEDPALLTPVEEILAGIWAELFGLERVGAADHFFALGGHSLLATQVMSRLRSAFGIEMPLRVLFEAPILRELAARVEAARLAGAVQHTPPLVPMPRKASLPPSFAQQRLWFIDRLAPGSSLYNIPLALRIQGPLDSQVLSLCLAEIVRRHEALRTVFDATEGSPAQVIRPAAPFLLPTVDLSGLPEKKREALALALAGEEAVRPFNLTRGPFLRGMLLRLAPRDHVAALTMHHIVSDAWSLGILVREVTALYGALLEGRPSPLPELPIQYADFAIWQRGWLDQEALAGLVDYWRRQLAGLPPRLELPTDHPRPAAQSFRGGRRPARLPAPLTRQAQALSRWEGATLFMVLLAGFQALLARYSRQQDLAVGTPIAGRNQREVEGLIGFFVNTLVMRGDLARQPSFRELLRRVRETALAAYLHQDVPFEKLVEELAPERSLAHAPLFQAMLVLQNAPVASLEIANLRLRPVGDMGTTAKFDLTLSLAEGDGELRGRMGYATDLFDAVTIDRLVIHYERLLAAILASPETSVAELPLLSPAELHQAIAEWSDTGAPASEMLLPDLLAARAELTPELPAVAQAGETLTHRELAARSDHLAAHLRALGAGPDVLVALYLERSVDLVVALFAVLKSGGAYLPLDTSLPRPRLAFLLDDARPALVLTRTRLLPDLPAPSSWVLCLDDLLEVAVAAGPPVQPAADNLAYVLYTSGSTGAPKGVAVTHRGLASYLLWAAEAYPAGHGRGAPVHSPVSFDLTVTSLFLPLLAGRCVELVPEEAGVEGLAAALAEGGFGLVKLTPAHLEVLQRLLPPERVAECADAFVIGGEPLSGEQLAFWREHAPGLRLINEYGPTETVVGCCIYEVPGSSPAKGPVPIGRPIANTRMLLLDQQLQPVPVGVAGELYIGGAGVCRGYLDRPDLTADRLVPDPFGTRGERLYRTGDLARLLPDGRIEFLGRTDHQVKVRGFRIELGEIEAVLLSLAGVREAVVLTREEAAGDRRLIAYVTGDAKAEELRQALRERLPDYMVPSAFVTLAAIPLTANGKVDRKALPAPERHGREEDPEPRTPVEGVLAAIWAELLGVERVGTNGHFFELGGHSLLATKLMSRLQRAFGVEMPLRDVFEAPRLAELAARIEAARETASGRLLPPLVPVPREGPLPLSFAQQRLWFLHQMDPLSPAYNMPFAFRLSGPLAIPALAASLTEVVRRHETLRTTLVLTGDEPVQSIATPAPQPLSVVDLAALPAGEREALALRLGREEAARPFDLARAPVVRTLLLRLGESDHVLLFTIHHVSGDAWSAEVLDRELLELYAAAVAARAPRMPALPVQYADFAVWQRSWLQGDVLAAQLEHWRRQLSGAPLLLEMPLDRPRPPVPSFRGGRRRLWLPAELAASLASLGRREGATGFMTLLAGFQALLHRYSGQESVVVGTPIANRQRAELEGLIGFFVNTLALRADFAGDPGFTALLAQVRETALGAFAHQDLPFERLVDELAPERHMSYAPVFQALFVYQNAARRRARDLGALSLEPFGTDEGVARFDLTLACAETASGVAVVLDYNADLFAAATADRMLRLFSHLLAQMAAQPQRPIGELSLLDAEEHAQVVLAWNTTACPRVAEELSLHALFARQAALAPELPAVIADGLVVGYGELAGWAGRIAGRLRRLGVGAEDRVGVCLERSPAALAALLGALAAGAAYVPLDPEWPRERLAAVAADAGLAALLTRSGLEAGAGLAPHLVLVEEARHGAPADLPWARPASAEAAAYVIYTSGSTGAAKGVVIPHRAAANFVLALGAMLELMPADRLLLFAPLSFDASVLQIFPALSRGAAVVVHPDPRELAGAGLLGFCERHGVTVLDLPAALWRQWIEDMAAEARALPAGIRTFLTGGESVPVERVRAWAQMTCRTATFLSSYGPTEATVTATVFLTDSGKAAALPAGKVPIGCPLANVRTYVLDARMHPVPAGVAGELYLAGDGLARGYLGQPGLTAASFLPDAVGSARGGRLYRTGDLARRLSGGDLEFLGRADTQVKIRGFRLELSEVEAVLGRHPALAECVVVVREDQPGDRRLVAYAVPQPGAITGVSELRAFVAERLPHYMVPAAFVLLGALPVLASGKVDRAALPSPESGRPEIGTSYSPPSNPTEEALAALWAQVLHLDRVGVHDNFFELGGDSILSIQILARANQRGMRLTARQIFEHPTVVELARLAASAPLLAAEQGLVTGAVPMTPIQRWFFAENFTASHHFNQAVVLAAAAPLAPATLERAVAALASHHDALRMRFPREDGMPRQENAGLDGAAPLVWIDLSSLPVDQQVAARAAAQDAVQASFDLERGPLTRLAAFDAGAHGRLLLWAAHHLVVDGVSWRVLIEDLATAFQLAAEGRPPLLPAKTTSFRAWAERLIGHARSGGFHAELPYWLGVVGREAARLPVDLPEGRAANTVESGLTVSVTLTPEETQTLLQTVPSTYRTQINDALLAALARAFSTWTGSPAIVVDLEAHGREPLFDDVDLSRTVGWFTTYFPVRLDLDGASGAVASLLAVKEQLRRIPGRGIGYALLVHEGGPEAAPLRAASPPQVGFNYLGQFDQTTAEAALFRLTDGPAGTMRDPRSHRTHLIEVSGLVAGGQLRLGFGYSASLHRRETIERLAASFGSALRDLIAECRLGEEAPLAPSDFPLLNLDEKSFGNLSALLVDED
jgi:amino acid adenylation domain-containing protein/non-ribosomal peptide synthase protein (TIGR01720 family)